MSGKESLLGAWGEQRAAQYLRKKHYQIIACNYHSRFGEIDLICKKGIDLVFVEVKLRKDALLVQPREYVTQSKQKKMIQTALYYLSEHPQDLQIRFDIIEIIAPQGLVSKKPEIVHWENAFDATLAGG